MIDVCHAKTNTKLGTLPGEPPASADWMSFIDVEGRDVKLRVRRYKGVAWVVVDHRKTTRLLRGFRATRGPRRVGS